MRLVATVSNSKELKLAEKADLIELRLDLGEFKEIPRGNFIVTCRRKSEGGLYEGEEEIRIEKMRLFAERVDAELVDLEFDLSDNYFDEFNCMIIE
ncbi:MAG: type I 3-dehydroquinate dehydratase, partial [Archaeoglobaceae archaeon]|nr:type I 3-dehydroquinate dehydratase [Archaeoglobaceae archaeon]MDW8118199.1 type I 3-dehydroquinate dehydratase [Archaeoglobaceae archaeon]